MLFFVLGAITLREYIKLVDLRSKFWRIASFVFLAFWIYYFNYLYDKFLLTYVLAAIVVLINLQLVRDLYKPQEQFKMDKQGKAGLLYVIGGFVFLTLIPARESGFLPDLIGAVFVLVWANDSFAYLVGKTFGKHKFFPAVSPKKTWEGFFGGLAGSIAAAIAIHHYLGIYPLAICLGLAIIVSVMGTMGDLVESRFKRVAGVKDSGRLMPGHGGLYDRLDSIIFASPFVYSFLEIVDYVS